MEELSEVFVGEKCGVEGDFRGKPGRRQVTVLARAGWSAACSESQCELPWIARRANLWVEGVEFDASKVGRVLRIGSLELEIIQETDPCERMDEAHPGLQAALKPHWRGGVCCRVRRGGHIHLGDEVSWIPFAQAGKV